MTPANIGPTVRHPTLVLIVGPIAAGKSTIAGALAAVLRRSGEQVALVGLDEIAAMALPTLPDWTFAHSIFGSVVGQWLRSPLDVVVAEGPGNRTEVGGVLTEVPTSVTVVTVVLTSTFDVAFSRAKNDSTRVISRDHRFLSDEFSRWEREMPTVACDVVIDTGRSSVDDSVSLIRSAFARTRE